MSPSRPQKVRRMPRTLLRPEMQPRSEKAPQATFSDELVARHRTDPAGRWGLPDPIGITLGSLGRRGGEYAVATRDPGSRGDAVGNRFGGSMHPRPPIRAAANECRDYRAQQQYPEHRDFLQCAGVSSMRKQDERIYGPPQKSCTGDRERAAVPFCPAWSTARGIVQ